MDEKKRESTEVSVEPMSEDAAAAEEERELDPVALNKAFRLAAWSSVILVRALKGASHPDRRVTDHARTCIVYRPLSC